LKLEQQNSLPKLLGYLGLIPFLCSALLIWIPQFHHIAVQCLTIYATVILTFIGGVHWGIALQQSQNTDNTDSRFIFSVIPSLVAWLAVVFIKPYALIILVLCFIAFRLVEKRLYEQSIPLWYAQLRDQLTVIATLAILVGWVGTR